MSWLDDLLLRLEMTVDPGSTPDLPPRPVTERIVTGMSPSMDRAANLLDTGDKTLLNRLLQAKKVSTDWDRKMGVGVEGDWNRLGGTMRVSPENTAGFQSIRWPRAISDTAATSPMNSVMPEAAPKNRPSSGKPTNSHDGNSPPCLQRTNNCDDCGTSDTCKVP